MGARLLIGLRNDSLPDFVAESNVNEAWHKLDAALALAEPASPVAGQDQGVMASRDHDYTGGDWLCSDCPWVGYPTDKTRCIPCPRRTSPTPEPEKT